ncbi:hypothetical protein DRW07_11045 [Alteromonas sediminis]|uniref:Uncharacterized protein n=1 Tax=Alteromonas sediminis TaxID=2259342 RepID=A0A3N5YMI2_9ALTE|nr:hypothetical protein [Alteromonas sediminis]RPJ66611.1 hypothetical protein DRW07_11045 [Alteromonas sediminis]
MKYLLLFINLLACMIARADGMVVDKVYHPYVTANEREFEWRLMTSQTDNSNLLTQRFGYGHAVLENVALEIYAIGTRDENNNFELSAFEVESRWMLTQQGEFWADWGLVLEFEKQKAQDNFEASAGILFEKEFGRTSLTMNLFAIREWGESLDSEWESEFRLQYRYRYLPEIQPSIEIYAGEDFIGIGPGFMGVYRIDRQEQIKWDAGFITEVAHSGKNHTFRFAIEYEF